jgi:hypothetical protein
MPRHPLVVSTRPPDSKVIPQLLFLTRAVSFARSECGRVGTVVNFDNHLGRWRQWNLRTVRQSTDEMLDPHP